MTAVLAPSHSLALRIFHPEETENPRRPKELFTLRQVFDKHLRKELAKRKKKTLIDYETLLNDWERLTDNLSASELSRPALIDFQEQLQLEPKRDGEPRSPATINKKFRTFGKLIKICWPADSHNPGGLGLCKYFLPPEPLEENGSLPRTFSYSELERLYAACSGQVWPIKNAVLTWQTILVTHFTSGPRTYDLLSLEWNNIDWKYRDVGALSYQAAKTGKLQRVPLHAAARAHLQKLWSCSQSDRIFPGFNYTNSSTIRRHWRKMLERAGIESAHMEDMRKTCNTAYNDRWTGVGDYILGHKLGGVNARFYYNPTRKVLRAVEKLPVPDLFHSLS